MSLHKHRLLLAATAAAVVAATASGCSDGTPATAKSASPVATSPSPSATPSPTLTAQQAASRAAYNAYVGAAADLDAVVKTTRDQYDPRLQRHATSTGFTILSGTVKWYASGDWGIRGRSKVASWKPTKFAPPTKPVAVTATACLDSSDLQVYSRKTGKINPPLPGHERVPVLVQAQVDEGVWKVVYLKPNPDQTC